MAQKIRLANKTQWALQGISLDCKEVRRQWDKAMGMAEHNHDPALMQVLARLIRKVDKIDRRAILALQGEFDPEE